MSSWSKAFRMVAFLVLTTGMATAQEIGTIHRAGCTNRADPHGGSCGRMIDVDHSGYVSLVWTKCFNDDPYSSRVIYYNAWDSDEEEFVFDTMGVRVDAFRRSGYVCQSTSPEGFCFAAFHGVNGEGDFRLLVAAPYAPYSDAYATFEIPPCQENGTEVSIGYPKIDADIHNNLHVISTTLYEDNPNAPLRIYYSRGVPEFDEFGFFLDINWEQMSCGGFDLWDTVKVVSADIACSRHSNRVAAAWCHPANDLFSGNNEIYLRVSEDGGVNWDVPVNVTPWTRQDTVRAFNDCSILFDESDQIHIAFTVTETYAETDTTHGVSLILHWAEGTDELSLVANGWWPEYTIDPGTWQLFVQQPSLAIDTLTHHLYCSYQQLDPEALSWSGLPLADAYVTVSTDNGHSWAAGTNVTNSTPDTVPVPPGENRHECDITVAPLVTDGFLHMEYVMDKGAEVGHSMPNPVIYQRIPIDQIVLHASNAAHEPPKDFVLHANYPNPFNPTTTLQFDLIRNERVTLKIFNVLGQEVASLLNKARLGAGVHRIEFDGSRLPSGVYFYRLQAGDFAETRKMILLK